MRHVGSTGNLFGRARLSAYVIAGNICLFSGSVGHDIAQKLAHGGAGLWLDELLAAGIAFPLEKGWRNAPAAVNDGRCGGHEGERRDRNSVTKPDGCCLDVAP